MYHTSDKNQHLNLKSFSNSSLSYKKLQFDGDIPLYLRTCTPSQIKIAHILLEYRYHPTVKLKNNTLASLSGYTNKTVTRATNKFLKDGFITKHQQNRYAPNHYTFNEKIKKGSHAFSYWFNTLSPDNQQLYSTHGIRIDHKNKMIFSIRNVPHYNISSLILDNLFINTGSSTCRAPAPANKMYKKKEVKVNETQKQLILQNRHNPKIMEIIKNPAVWTEIITPQIEKITSLLSLDEQEQLNLIAFDENTLNQVINSVEPVVTGYKPLRSDIKNKMGWMLGIAKDYCTKNNLKPDWKWYYDLSEILGISTFSGNPKPLVIQKPIMAQSPVKSSTRDEHVNKLKRELKKREANIAFYGVEPSLYDKKVIAKLKQEINEYEGACNEKQSVPNQYSPSHMVTGTA